VKELSASYGGGKVAGPSEQLAEALEILKSVTGKANQERVAQAVELIEGAKGWLDSHVLRENPDASHVDWILAEEQNYRARRGQRDHDRWLKEHPNGTPGEWEQEKAERRAACRQKQKEREQAQWEEQRNGRRRKGEPFVAHWVPREDDGAVVPSYYDEETGELIELPRDAWPEHLRQDQGLRRGEVLDPHWGPYGPGAPYGYHDGTGEPREEPLYDANGYPIVPRAPLRSRSGYVTTL